MVKGNRGQTAILTMFLLFQMLCSTALAQELDSFRSGTFHSPKGFGICAEFNVDSASFNAVTVIADMYGVLIGEHSRPGFKFTYTRDIIIRHLDKDGYSIDIYAGPGLTAGYARDLNKPYSLIAGMACVAGSRFSFPTKLSVNIELCSDFALGLAKNPKYGNIDLSIYKYGIYHTLFPQLRIQYAF